MFSNQLYRLLNASPFAKLFLSLHYFASRNVLTFLRFFRSIFLRQLIGRLYSVFVDASSPDSCERVEERRSFRGNQA